MGLDWKEAARNYSRLGEADRAAYWAGLDPEQQRMLEEALKETQPASQHSTAPQRKGCLKTAMVGCGGMILGCVLTIAGEFWALSAGVQAVSDIFKGASASTTEDPLDPMPEFCKNGMIYADANEKFYCAQWAERHKH